MESNLENKHASIVGKIYQIHYTHARDTYAGKVVTSGILSTWDNEDDAEDAERRAWAEYGWSRDRTRTSIRSEDVLKQNA